MKMSITVKTLSPVHIGGKNLELSPLEAVVTGGRCYIVDETLLGMELLAKNRLDSLAYELKRRGPRFELANYFHGLGYLNQNFLDKVNMYCCQTPLTKTPNRLRPFIRDAFSQPFVPGSSIKGVIRTAVMYGLLKKMKSQQSQEFERYFIDQVKRKLNEYLQAEEWKRNKTAFKDSIKRNMAVQMERELMQRFNLPVPASSGRGLSGPNRDFMRVLKVSDSIALDKDSLVLREIQILSLTTGKEVYLKTPLYVEVIPTGTELSFSVSLDEGLLGDLKRQNKGQVPFNSLSEVWEMTRDFSQDLWLYESNYWGQVIGPGVSNMRNFYRRTPAGFRIGWGSGLAGASLLMLLPVDLARKIRDALFMPRGDAVFPKSRRAVMEDNDPGWPLGWITLNN